MSLMCLAKRPDLFKAAVAGAPVTSWDGYDTHYTERYMGTPISNPDGYVNSSVMEYASNIRGELMLIHGLIDENVHFRHSARLINSANNMMLEPDMEAGEIAELCREGVGRLPKDIECYILYPRFKVNKINFNWSY